MAAVKVSVVALEQSGIGSVAVGPARLPDSGVASTAAQIPACLENRAIPYSRNAMSGKMGPRSNSPGTGWG